MAARSIGMRGLFSFGVNAEKFLREGDHKWARSFLCLYNFKFCTDSHQKRDLTKQDPASSTLTTEKSGYFVTDGNLLDTHHQGSVGKTYASGTVGTSKPVSLERGIGRTLEEQHYKVLLDPDQPPNPRVLRFSIIGTPNAGKSTLINQLMRWKVTSVSSKVHTTRKNTLAVLTEGNTQIVFLDTPGLISFRKRTRHHLEKSLVTDPRTSFQTADLAGVIVDVSNYWTRNELGFDILQLLHMNPHLPSILILNKVDLLKKKDVLLTIVRELTEGVVGGWRADIKTKKNKGLSLSYILKKAGVEMGNVNEGSGTVTRKQQLGNSDVLISERKDFLKQKSGEVGVHPSDTEVNKSTVIEYQLLDVNDKNTSHGDVKLHQTEESGLRQCSEKSKMISENKRLITNHGVTTDEGGERVGLAPGDWMDYQSRVSAVKAAIRGKCGWAQFDRVFMLSALTGDGVDDIKEYLMSMAQPGKWEYHSSLVTNQDPREMTKNYVWEKLLDYLPQEIPYSIGLNIVVWELDENDLLRIIVDIICTKKKYFHRILGRGGQTVKKVAEEAKQELANAFRCELCLKLQVKFWRK